MAVLKEDIRSEYRKKVIYGKAGDKVKIITDGDVLIVEAKNGYRFPVNRERVIIN